MDHSHIWITVFNMFKMEIRGWGFFLRANQIKRCVFGMPSGGEESVVRIHINLRDI